MLGLYRRHYSARYRAIAALIPDGSSVLDLCCGPAILYTRYLRRRQVSYTGLDLSEPFIARLNERGGCGLVWNLREDAPLPQADYVVMQASLCHFLPDPVPVLDRMLQAARLRVIVAEPIRNMASSGTRLIAAIGRRFTDPGDGHSAQRFTEETLDSLFAGYSPLIADAFYVPGKREKVYLLDAGQTAPVTLRTRSA
jgi:SAM-dependent methyltransferase